MNRVSLMLDSGAFSAWTRDKRIDLKTYIKFCHLNDSSIFKAINLDVIPARPGAVPSPRQVQESAEQGWKNFVAMRKAGVDSIPVFHAGEDLRWLDKMLDSGVDYVGLSASSIRMRRNNGGFGPHEWLDEIWSHLCGNGGYPSVKVHGFMLTSPDVFTRYPWYSTDSTSWVIRPSYGACVVPKVGPDGKYNYRLIPDVVYVADTPKNPKAYNTKGDPVPSLHDGSFNRDCRGVVVQGEHYDQLSKPEQEAVIRYLHHCGFTLEQVRANYEWRCAIGAVYYVNLCKQSPLKSLPELMGVTGGLPTRGLFSTPISPRGDSTPPSWTHPRIFLGIPQANQHMKALNRVRAFDRLISYFYFYNKPAAHQPTLEHLARTGLYWSSKKRTRL